MWISNYINYKLWSEIAYPYPNFNGCTSDIFNFIPHFIVCDYLSMLGFEIYHVSKRGRISHVYAIRIRTWMTKYSQCAHLSKFTNQRRFSCNTIEVNTGTSNYILLVYVIIIACHCPQHSAVFGQHCQYSESRYQSGVVYTQLFWPSASRVHIRTIVKRFRVR